MNYCLGITGASGMIYTRRFLENFDFANHHLDVVLSESAVVYRELEAEEPLDLSKYDCKVWGGKDFRSPVASGSARYDGMAIVPCTAGTLGRVASGISDNLITRAADVFLKEKRPLIVVIRENPLSLVHLDNMKTLALAGATIMTANPHFYSSPKNFDELADTVVARVFDHLHLDMPGVFRWGQTSVLTEER